MAKELSLKMNRLIVYTIFISFLLSTTTANAEIGFLKLFISPSHPNCPHALPPHHQKFCRSFQDVAQCHCTSAGLPASMCKNMQSLHKRMTAIFDSQQKACAFQKDASMQACMESWNCYRLGGKDAKGRLCQASGKACATPA